MNPETESLLLGILTVLTFTFAVWGLVGWLIGHL
jgi:hypothetical protein